MKGSPLSLYVRSCADRMGLRDWTIVLKPDPPKDEANIATATLVPGRRVLSLRFQEHVMDLDPDEIRHAVTHELVHAHFAYLTWTARTDLDDVGWTRFKTGLEIGIDGVAEALAPSLDLPPWG